MPRQSRERLLRAGLEVVVCHRADVSLASGVDPVGPRAGFLLEFKNRDKDVPTN